MGTVRIVSKGSFKNTKKFFKSMLAREHMKQLEMYAELGVSALSAATPVDTGETASSWGYTIEETKKGISIVWTNSNVNEGVPIALILQYGHGTGTGGYVKGRDYINPAIRPIFDKIAEKVWNEVKNA